MQQQIPHPTSHCPHVEHHLHTGWELHFLHKSQQEEYFLTNGVMAEENQIHQNETEEPESVTYASSLEGKLETSPEQQQQQHWILRMSLWKLCVIFLIPK